MTLNQEQSEKNIAKKEIESENLEKVPVKVYIKAKSKISQDTQRKIHEKQEEWREQNRQKSRENEINSDHEINQKDIRSDPPKFCPFCGQQVSPGGKFCPNCGNSY